MRRQSWLTRVLGMRAKPTLSSAVLVPDPECLARGTFSDTPVKPAALSMALPSSSARVLLKCMSYLQIVFDNAPEDEIKNDLQEQMKYLQKIRSKVLTRGPTSAEVLGGEADSFCFSRSYTRWHGYDV